MRDYLMEACRPYAETMRVDGMGNLIVKKRGTEKGTFSLLIAAHMDEVGLIVRQVTDEGYLKFDTVGGIDRRVLLGKRVLVGKSALHGVIGTKPYHLLGEEERKSVPKLSDLLIDMGAKSGEELKEHIFPGDVAVFVGDAICFGEGMIRAKSLDDRIGCAVMFKLLRQSLPMDVTFVFTVQEEVGTRGALGAAFSDKPDIALILEGTTAADLPSMEEHKRVCHLGKGPVVPFMDGGTIYDRGLFELLRELAQEQNIPWQTKHYISGGTDASAIQKSRSGVRVAGISAAVRYLHAPNSVAHWGDIAQMEQLATAFIHALAKGRNRGGVQ